MNPQKLKQKRNLSEGRERVVPAQGLDQACRLTPASLDGLFKGGSMVEDENRLLLAHPTSFLSRFESSGANLLHKF